MQQQYNQYQQPPQNQYQPPPPPQQQYQPPPPQQQQQQYRPPPQQQYQPQQQSPRSPQYQPYSLNQPQKTSAASFSPSTPTSQYISPGLSQPDYVRSEDPVEDEVDYEYVPVSQRKNAFREKQEKQPQGRYSLDFLNCFRDVFPISYYEFRFHQFFSRSERMSIPEVSPLLCAVSFAIFLQFLRRIFNFHILSYRIQNCLKLHCLFLL